MALLTVWLSTLCAGVVQAMPSYRVGVASMDYLPYSQVLEGEYRGLHRELLDRFARYAGVEFEYIPLPYARSVKTFLAGQLDFQYPDDPAWLPELPAQVKSEVVYSEPAIPYVDGFMQLSSQPDFPQDQLRLVGSIIGFTLTDYYPLQRAGQLRIAEQGSVGALIDQVLHQRLDGIYLNVDVVAHRLRQLGEPSLLRFNAALPYRKGFYRMSSIQYPELIAQFDQFLLDESAWIAALTQRYGVNEYTALEH